MHLQEFSLISSYISSSYKKIKEVEKMLRLSEEAEKMDKGVAVLNGKFIGPPMVITAKKILKKHELIQRKS